MEYLASYQNVLRDRILSAKPEMLMVMLYEGMITRVKQAQEYFRTAQTIRCKEAAIKAMNIASALMDHLNLEEGGEPAKNLERLYAYIVSELVQSTRVSDPSKHFLNVLSVLSPLHESWQKLAERN
ncbi:MAG: flagellar export chaperone FliS [Deltaproteobacteria bacterium]|nr:flagellar export chaperone FliS [Deltaproteobacteria bacterium]